MTAELAARAVAPPPAGLPHGEFVCTRLEGGDIRIDHADPRILISGEVLDSIARFADIGLPVDCVTLNAWLDTTGCMPPPWRATYRGAILKIGGVNRTVIYRITEYLPSIHGYIGEWPD